MSKFEEVLPELASEVEERLALRCGTHGQINVWVFEVSKVGDTARGSV